jgi:hypothetical protein
MVQNCAEPGPAVHMHGRDEDKWYNSVATQDKNVVSERQIW